MDLTLQGAEALINVQSEDEIQVMMDFFLTFPQPFPIID
jgi:hypothetical protein